MNLEKREELFNKILEYGIEEHIKSVGQDGLQDEWIRLFKNDNLCNQYTDTDLDINIIKKFLFIELKKEKWLI